MLSGYRKAIVAAIPALLAIIKVISDAAGVGHVTSAGWATVAVTALGAVAVYVTPNAAVPPAAPTLLTAPSPVDTATIVVAPINGKPPA